MPGYKVERLEGRALEELLALKGGGLGAPWLAAAKRHRTITMLQADTWVALTADDDARVPRVLEDMRAHAAAVAGVLDTLGWRIERGRISAGPGGRESLDLLMAHTRRGRVCAELTWSRKTAAKALANAEEKLPKYWEHLAETGATRVGALGTAEQRLHFAVYSKRGADACYFANERFPRGCSSGASKRSRGIGVDAESEWREANSEATSRYRTESKARKLT